MPPWVEYAIFWHLYPLGFVGAEIHPARPAPLAHRLNRLQNWLDYAVELGASALLLGPIFASATHGYDTLDHFRIDPRLGDDGDFDSLIAAARSRCLSVVLDGVFNHVSRRHPLVEETLAQGRAAPHASWFRFKDDGELEVFEGHGDLVALNSDSPDVEDYVVAVMNHWLDRGAAGWRLDAAYAMSPQFWARVLSRVRARHADAFVFAELIHGDYADFVAASGVDSVTQYELWKAIWSSFNDRNFFELSWALERHNGFLAHFVPQTFIGNHDVTRVASRLEDAAGLEQALALLCVLGGVPSIYAGDEQGFRGVKEDRIGGDDAVRPEFPQAPQDLPADGGPLYRRHQELLGLRRRHPWLIRAQSRAVHVENTRLVIEAAAAEQRLCLALNLEGPAELPAPGMRKILAGRGARLTKPGAAARVRLAEKGWAILSPGAA